MRFNSNLTCHFDFVSASMMSSTHHFYPLDIRLVDYAANTATTFELLGAFTAATVVILGAGLGFAKWTRPLMSKCDSLLVAWFVFSKFYDDGCQASIFGAARASFYTSIAMYLPSLCLTISWLYSLVLGRLLCR